MKITNMPLHHQDRVESSRMSYSYGGPSAGTPPTRSTSPTMKSQSIPIGKVIPRTASELQLCMDEAIAEERDYMFYCRIVQGISQTQERMSRNRYLQYENQACLAHVIRTRHDQQHKQDQNGVYVPPNMPSTTYYEDDWAPGLSGFEQQPPLSSGASLSIVDSITSKALAIAESPDDGYDEGIFDLEL